MPVFINTKRLDRSIKGMRVTLRKGPYRKVGFLLRNYVRKTITMQGRKRPYKPLSWWTKKRTGRNKALITLRNRIKFFSDRNSASIYFDGQGLDFSITNHHFGFTSPAVSGKRMVVPNPSGGILAAFSSRRKSVIPPREVWPQFREVRRLVRREFRNFYSKEAKVKWR